MEDYRLWLSLIEQNSLNFANLGSIILKLRKHKKNYSSTHTVEDEAHFKLAFLSRYLSDEHLKEKLHKNPIIV